MGRPKGYIAEQGQSPQTIGYGRADATRGLAPGGLQGVPRRGLSAPRSWAERVYANLTYFDEVDRGGHFAAWEEPEIFAEEMRAAFSPLRLPDQT